MHHLMSVSVCNNLPPPYVSESRRSAGRGRLAPLQSLPLIHQGDLTLAQTWIIQKLDQHTTTLLQPHPHHIKASELGVLLLLLHAIA